MPSDRAIGVNIFVPSWFSLFIYSVLSASAVQAHDEEMTSGASAAVTELAPVEIHAVPLSSTPFDVSQPLSIFSKKRLRAEADRSSLGAMLGSTAGIQESGFGPGASRPIIRGMDGARLRIQRNFLSTGDLSSLSPDHAVAEELLLAQRVEVLQGAATLLYGTQAMGGVVNIVDDMLPLKQRQHTDAVLQLHTTSADHALNTAFGINGGSAPFNWSLQGFSRRSDNLRTPLGTLSSSDQSSEGGTVSASWKAADHHVGVQLSELSKNYGIAGTDGNRIDLNNQVVRLAGEHREPFSGIDRIRWNMGYTHYRHAEIEPTGEVGTRFKNNNTEGRIELTHRDGLGAFGLQWQQANTSAVGEESLMTPTSQRQIGIFTVQEKAIATGRASLGMRYDWVGSDNQGSPDGVSRAETSRHFSLVNASAGWVQPLKPWVDWNANISFSQRAPEIEALYAEGNHAAQQRYVMGNPNLKRERSINFDLGIKSPLAEHDKREWKLNVFYRRFHDFIYGETVWDALAQQPVRSAEGLIEEQMRQQSATFKGIEGSVQWQLPIKEWSIGAWGDIVSAKLADGSTPPRLASARLALNARYQKGNWQAEVQGLRRFKPRSLAAYETDTEASIQLDVKLAYRYLLKQNQPLNIWLEGTNLTNQLIRLHTSYLKDQAPLAGRGVHLGMELKF